MKFTKENTGKGVLVTNAALSLSNLSEGLLELRVENGVVMLFKQNMTVADLLKTADALGKTAADLIEKLTAACGECDGRDAECLFCQPTVSVASKNKDMASVLALLPQTKEFVTEDGLSGTLSLQLDTVKVDVAGYGSATKNLTATRTYPGLANQDTQYIPKSINDSGSALTLQAIDWQAQADGYFTAVATHTGTATSSYVKGYTVTADYSGEVSRINLSKTRYVAIFEGTPLKPLEPEPSEDPAVREPAASVPFNWAYPAGAPGRSGPHRRRRGRGAVLEAP